MKKYLCIHGHFYQPPRENPWTGVIEQQTSAAPYHDWNERINFECYAPNAHTHILNNHNQSLKTVNNYTHISFNFGPTLLTWMERNAPETYQSILKADRISMERFSGHGSALAQVYNHMILPLANERDKITQVLWGIRDFEYRFQRSPEGMWLSETAVNVRTLEILADQGILFTILSPTQAKRVKLKGAQEWLDVSEGTIDAQLPYLCRLPSGKTITLFFYNGRISNEVAFGQSLKNGVNFANSLIEEFPEHQQKARLVHIANDGETYGHHHAFGNMALAYMFYYVEMNQLAAITIYGEFLANNPPEYEVEIIEDTSWSCFHGVDRWKSHCGCHLDSKTNWNQKWRKYLRSSLDWLRDRLITIYEEEMSAYYSEPWRIRDEYIAVVLNPNDETMKSVLWDTARKKLDQDEQRRVRACLEMQHNAMLMYTSCGWFFDDVSGLETVQILQYAARAMQIARDHFSVDLEPEFLKQIGQAKSNKPEMKDGVHIYKHYVQPSMETPKQQHDA